MKFLLAAINAKYIHSNLGIYSLKAYADRFFENAGENRPDIQIGEYTINNQVDWILKDIYRRRPDVVGVSCYIWNISVVMKLVRDLPKVLPETEIWLGGPEVSYDAKRILNEERAVTGIIMGEGEETFARLADCYAGRDEFWHEPGSHGGETGEPVSFHPDGEAWDRVCKLDGVACRGSMGKIIVNPIRQPLDMNQIPFPYEDLGDFENRIIYYESSRGCPFSCSYCLSSLDKSVRFRDLKLVKEELDFFLNRRVPQVKFVDRTFNCNKRHTMEIWRHILDHDNGVTNFHFEISADLLDDEELDLMSGLRPGLIQLEIGVQSVNPDTIRAIRRKTDLARLEAVVDRVNGFSNIHQHLDLIAGLPFEDYESFRRSFNRVWDMKPEQLQLGFLKVLKGSYMAEMAAAYELKYKGEPPYEVLSTRWLSYEELLRLKGVEDMVEVYGNSGQFKETLRLLIREFDTPFDFFAALADEYEGQGLTGISHSRIARYEILERFASSIGNGTNDFEDWIGRVHDALTYDLYLRENIKSRPSFAYDQGPYRDRVREFFRKEAVQPCYLTKGYDGYEARQLLNMAHLEIFRDGTAVLFDYKHWDALTHNAMTFRILKMEVDRKEERTWQGERRRHGRRND